MKPNAPHRHVIDIMFVLALFGVFIVTALIVALMGSDVYKGTVENMNRNFDTQTSLTYVSTKIRQNDREDGVFLDSLSGISALVLEESVEGEIYQTWIYHHDGALREVFVKKGSGIDPDNGIAIMAVEQFSVEPLSENLYSITTMDRDGNIVGTIVNTRT